MKTEGTEKDPGHHRAPGDRHAPPTWQIVLAFAAVYLIWGSTYLGIRYAVETIPPFLMAGTRNLAAGLLMYIVARLRGAPRPTRGQWRDAAIAGVLLLAVGNGGVTWAEQVIPSGVTALMVALVPVWMVLLDWLRPGGVRPRPLVLMGLALGFVGVALLARNNIHGASAGYGWGVATLMAASFGWALGSIFARHARKPESPWLGIGMQMMAGGIALLAVAAGRGDAATFSWSRVSTGSMGAWLYLTAIGSLVGFTAYVWLLHATTPARVSTYAYVNPFIAVVLGCTLGREPLSGGLFVAGGLIVLAVVLIVRSSRSTAPANGRSGPGVQAAAALPRKPG